jgi:hypothetical protein
MSHLGSRRALGTALLTCCLTASLVSCGDDRSSSPPPAPPSASATDTPSSEAPTESSSAPASPALSVTVAGDQVRPNAQEVELEAGEALLLTIESDRAGELHVHARPEQYVEFGAGVTNARLVIDTPGTVEVEEHESGAVVAIIEVR